MLYYKCPSCKTLLADKQLPFEKEMDRIVKDTKMSEDEKNDAKRKLLDSLELVRYCCRTRMLTYVDLIKIIK